MAWPDSLLKLGFELLANITDEQVAKFLREPRIAKAILAKEIIKIFHSKSAADLAEEEFIKVFREKKLPSKIPEIRIKEKSLNILDLLMKTKLTASKAEAKRLILQNGVKIGGIVQNDWQKEIEIKKGLVIQVGKRKFVKLN